MPDAPSCRLQAAVTSEVQLDSKVHGAADGLERAWGKLEKTKMLAKDSGKGKEERNAVRMS